MKAAIELEIFTAIGSGSQTVPEIAKKTKASERGIQALCDYLVIIGFLTKIAGRYGLTVDSAIFLDKKSQAYIGGATDFMSSTYVQENFKDFTRVVREGRPNGALEMGHPAWVTFARAMGPLMRLAAEETARLVRVDGSGRVLDVAAGHGLFGIAMASKYPKAAVVGLDSAPVLEVAQENAKRAGVSERYEVLPGDALEVPFGVDFDVVLVPNLLHHWDRENILAFFRKAHAALRSKGRLAIVEFVPNEDRVGPPIAASFVMNMLAMTEGGNAYTASEYREMLAADRV